MAKRVDDETIRTMITMHDKGYSARLIADRTGRAPSTISYLLSVYAIVDDEVVRLPGRIEMHGKTWTRPVHTAINTHGSVTVEQGLNDGYIATVGDEWTGREAKSVHQAIISALIAASESV